MTELGLRNFDDIEFVEFPTVQEAGRQMAYDVASWLKPMVADHNAAFIAIPGGKSPATFFSVLSEQQLNWPNVRITLTDERWVPEDSAESNANLVRQNLLRGNAARAQFVMPRMVDATIDEAAGAWNLAMRRAPVFDLVALGMGDDGHFASLFPDSNGLDAALDPEGEALAVAVKDRMPLRLSLTLRALIRTRRLAFLVGGPEKRAILESVLRNEPAAAHLPISALLRHSPVTPIFYWGAFA